MQCSTIPLTKILAPAGFKNKDKNGFPLIITSNNKCLETEFVVRNGEYDVVIVIKLKNYYVPEGVFGVYYPAVFLKMINHLGKNGTITTVKYRQHDNSIQEIHLSNDKKKKLIYYTVPPSLFEPKRLIKMNDLPYLIVKSNATIKKKLEKIFQVKSGSTLKFCFTNKEEVNFIVKIGWNSNAFYTIPLEVVYTRLEKSSEEFLLWFKLKEVLAATKWFYEFEIRFREQIIEFFFQQGNDTVIYYVNKKWNENNGNYYL